MIKEEQQDEGEANHADDLSGDTNVVDNGHQSYAGNIDERADDDGEEGDKDGVWHTEDGCRDAWEDGEQGDGNGVGHRGDGENACEEVDPPGKPAQGRAGEALTPLVD